MKILNNIIKIDIQSSIYISIYIKWWLHCYHYCLLKLASKIALNTCLLIFITLCNVLSRYTRVGWCDTEYRRVDGIYLGNWMLKLKLQYFGHLILGRPLLLLPPIPPSIWHWIILCGGGCPGHDSTSGLHWVDARSSPTRPRHDNQKCL